MVETIQFCRRKLPHWLVAERPYFVTLRLKGTLPAEIVQDLKAERDRLSQQQDLDEKTWTDLHRRQFVRIEGVLDACDGERKWLTIPDVATMLLKNLSWIEENRKWRIHAVTVMPNHLHLLMRNVGGRNGELLNDLGHFKGFVGEKANQILDRSGGFWAREDFDHWCRTPDKTTSVARYICNNPVKAGLAKKWSDWPWTRCEDAFKPE